MSAAMKSRPKSSTDKYTRLPNLKDEASDVISKKEHQKPKQTVRGQNQEPTKQRTHLYDTFHKGKLMVGKHPATRQWTGSDEDLHEVKAHILDTQGLQDSQEWESFVGKGITNLVIEDHDTALTEIPPSITNIQTLKKFSLKWAKNVTAFPMAMFEMDLKEMCIQKCPIRKLKGIHLMDSLTKLELSNGSLQKIPSEMGEMTSLKHLDLTGNMIKVLPPGIGNVQGLTTLIVCGNKLTVLPGSITKLIKLETLDASQNQIKQLPGDIGKLQGLANIRMSHNHLCELPESVRDLHNLKQIYLGNNLFTDIPLVLGQINELTTINLESNQVKDIQTPLPRLTTLLLDKNLISELHGALFGCVSLEKLSVQHNKITVIPSDIRRLTKLRALYLSGNSIEVLPEEVCSLQELRHLVMKETCIQELPIYFDSLKNLSVLNLENTKVNAKYVEVLQTDGIGGLLKLVRLKRIPDEEFLAPPDKLVDHDQELNEQITSNPLEPVPHQSHMNI